MDLNFNKYLTKNYKSATQIARILTEDWLNRNMYCPVCGEMSLKQAEPNAPVKDYVCNRCKSQYELKSQKSISCKFSNKINDGAYETMIARITSLENPSFFFMHYDDYEVNNLIIVPNCFFVPGVVEKRKPLAPNARRSGWTGCNILLGSIPAFAKIPVIKNKIVQDPRAVVKEYNRLLSLKTHNLESRGWMFYILECIEKLDKTFTLQELYKFVPLLKIKYPLNNNIEAKIRQQLQLLRDKHFVEFISPGKYRKIF